MLVGANFEGNCCSFSVWAPNHKQVKLLLTQDNQLLGMLNMGNGYFGLETDMAKPGDTYLYRLDRGQTKPDPASHFQPTGVFGASAVIDHTSYAWKDADWRGIEVEDLVFYEVHVGAFTSEGTFKSMMTRIGELADFGVNALELMPIVQFSGRRNWGYDGVFPFAVQNTYGQPSDLKALVDECHRHGVALFLDFVYNHVGPEGNCLNDYGPYFPPERLGRWGPNVNLDGDGSLGVRNYFLQNTRHWFSHYHIDGIRLDAVFTMLDKSPTHFLSELAEETSRLSEETGRKFHLISESGYHIPQVLASRRRGGFGFDAEWLDDYQHAVFAAITGERRGYYINYGKLGDVAEALKEGYINVGDEVGFRRKSPDQSYGKAPANQLVVFSQNHDQVGNRLLGDRLTTIVGQEAAKLAAGMVLLSPYVPLLFMGEEYGEVAPFLFFTDFQDPKLIAGVREGRKKEFAAFNWAGEVPDPQSPDTFNKSKVDWSLRRSERGKKTLDYFRALLELRKNPLFHPQKNTQIKNVAEKEKILFIQKQNPTSQAVITANFSVSPIETRFPYPGEYIKVFDSAAEVWNGPGATLSPVTSKSDGLAFGGFNFAVFLKNPARGGKKVG
jgi:maltooligosyltrehalose trehalohydrolase